MEQVTSNDERIHNPYAGRNDSFYRDLVGREAKSNGFEVIVEYQRR